MECTHRSTTPRLYPRVVRGPGVNKTTPPDEDAHKHNLCVIVTAHSKTPKGMPQPPLDDLCSIIHLRTAAMERKIQAMEDRLERVESSAVLLTQQQVPMEEYDVSAIEAIYDSVTQVAPSKYLVFDEMSKKERQRRLRKEMTHVIEDVTRFEKDDYVSQEAYDLVNEAVRHQQRMARLRHGTPPLRNRGLFLVRHPPKTSGVATAIVAKSATQIKKATSIPTVPRNELPKPVSGKDARDYNKREPASSGGSLD